ncbi:40S ribosomal protein S9 [Poronia punctata]|nr:40S ribosomal protein S9 [Poronia punctata]
MSSLRYGARCLRTLTPSITKQWPSLLSSTCTQSTKSIAARRAFVTTPQRRDVELWKAMPEPESDEIGIIVPFARPVPASPSYFSRQPQFTDQFIRVRDLAQKYAGLPTVTDNGTERIFWLSKEMYRGRNGEPVKAKDYAFCLKLVRRLSRIHPDVMPEEVKEGIKPFQRRVEKREEMIKQRTLDRFGRAMGVGGRKVSTARAWVVEGTGEVLINGKPLSEAFGRVHDRESAIWSLKATERLDKYNVWALVKGGGTTGQAEALAMAIAQALVVHEPPLKTTLRRAGCITRDPRMVERKKAGHLKARKSPAWVKR